MAHTAPSLCFPLQSCSAGAGLSSAGAPGAASWVTFIPVVPITDRNKSWKAAGSTPPLQRGFQVASLTPGLMICVSGSSGEFISAQLDGVRTGQGPSDQAGVTSATSQSPGDDMATLLGPLCEERKLSPKSWRMSLAAFYICYISG